MDQSEGNGIKVCNVSPQVLQPPSSSCVHADAIVVPPNGGICREAHSMANGFHKTLSKTSQLANFLPTGTLLTFELVLPSIYSKGECSGVATTMIHCLLAICTLSCFFFHFTDSFRGPDGKVYYGFVTPWGLKAFESRRVVEAPNDQRYKVRFRDFVHAMMSVVVFVAIAFSDLRVTACLFPRHTKEMEEVMESFPLMLGIVCSGLYLVFPNNRHGIGCLSA